MSHKEASERICIGEASSSRWIRKKADPAKRIQCQHMIKAHEPLGDPIIYIDESGFAVDMPRVYGYAPRGQRCLGTHDWQAKGRINVIGARQGNTRLTTCLCKASGDSATFHAWLTQQLLPVLPKKSVMVMDNAAFHKRQDTQVAIESNGHRLRFPPLIALTSIPLSIRGLRLKPCVEKSYVLLNPFSQLFICERFILC